MRPTLTSRLSAATVTTPTATILHYLSLGLVVLVGAFLRFTMLRQQSLWFDEIDVVVRAQRPLDEVLRTFIQAGENGPLYNILLALWVRLVGVSEIAVRVPSAVAGVLAIPLMYALARRTVGPTAGLLAAGLLTISPYHIWYSQEAKMYTLVVLLALLSSLALVEALERDRRLPWAAYAISTTLMFYTHVATVLVFVAQTIYVILARRAWPGRERGWFVAAAVLTLPYIPVALWALRVIGGGVSTWQADVGLWEAIRILGVKMAVNRADAVIEARGALLYAALAVGGTLVLAQRQRVRRWWLLFLSLAVVPVVGLYLVSLRQSVFSDRYAIVALPAYLMLVSAAVVWLVRGRRSWPFGALAIFLLLAFAWGPIRDVNRSETAQKEDWRSSYADLARRAQPGDGVIVHPGYLITTYEYFQQREPRLNDYPVAVIPSFKVKWLDEPLMVNTLREQLPGATRIWLVQSPVRVPEADPDVTLEGWLATHGQRLYESEVNGVSLSLFALNSPLQRLNSVSAWHRTPFHLSIMIRF